MYVHKHNKEGKKYVIVYFIVFIIFIVVPCILILSTSFLFSPTDALYICLGVHYNLHENSQ